MIEERPSVGFWEGRMLRTRFVRWLGVGMMWLAACAWGTGLETPRPPAGGPHTPPAFPLRLATEDGLAVEFSTEGRLRIWVRGEPLSSAPILPWAVRDLTQGLANFLEGEDLLQGAGGFEEPLEGAWQGVEMAGQAFPCQARRSEEQAYQGTASLKTPPQSRSACQSAPIRVEGGARYRLGGWWLAEPFGFPLWKGGAPLVESGMYWRLPQRPPPRVNGLFYQWLDAQGNPLPATPFPRLAVPLRGVTPGWTLVQAEVQAPPQAQKMRVIVQTVTTQEGDTLWVDGVRVIRSPEPYLEAQPEEIRPEGEDTVIYRARVAGLVLETTWKAYPDHIAVAGEVWPVDQAETRVLDLALRLPVEAQGGTFFRNLHQEEPIGRVGRFENAVSALHAHWLPVSLYPYLGVADEERSWGLGLATPPWPQFTRLFFEAAQGQMVGVAHLALSPLATKLAHRARFSFVLLSFDPDWGQRRLAEKYAHLYEDFFTPAFDLRDYVPPSSEIHPCYDPQRQGWRGLAEVVRANREGRLVSKYVSASLALEVLPTAEHPDRPTYAEIQAVVDALAVPRWAEEPAALACRTTPEEREDRAEEVARVVQASAALGPQGEPLFFGVSAPQWWSQGWWQAQWVANWDPDLPQGLGRWLLYRQIQPVVEATAALGGRLDFLRWDNFFAFSAIDHRPEALAAADIGLSYEPSYYTPGVPTAFSMAEWFAFLYGDYFSPKNPDLPALYREGKVGAGANAWAVSALKFLKLDLFGGEGATEDDPRAWDFAQAANWNPEILDFRRALAYHRRIHFSNFAATMSPEHARRFVSLAMLYGISVAPNRHVWEQWPPEALCAFLRADNLIAQYAPLGWEYVPYAWADAPTVRVERFGKSPEEGLYLVAYNAGPEPQEVLLRVDREGLGLSPPGREWALEEVVLDFGAFPLDQQAYGVYWRQHCLGGEVHGGRFALGRDGEVRVGVLEPFGVRVWRVVRR